jgi:serralysin
MALQAWADVANISFSRVAPGAYTNSATMLFANYSSSTDKAAGFAYRPSTDNTSAASPEGDVWYDAYDGSTTSLPIGDYDFYTILHEIGHAIGLLHPGDYNAGSGQTITYQAHALYIEDTRQYSAMSYFDASLTGASHYGSSAATPLLHDIAAVQRLYGANMTTRTGDTTYGFNSNAGRAAFDFNINTAPVIAIWDAGGIDTLDASGYYSSQFIDLRSGLFSNIGGLIKNVAIAEGATVENAKGGFGNDTLAGNGVGNVLHGNSGYDTLLGGAGVDVLYGGADNDTLDGGTEVDTLYGEGGDDTYKIYDGDVVYEVAGEGKDTITTETRNISLLDYLYGRDFSYIEAIILGGGLALSATGDNGANSFTGNSAANQFTGLGGDDTYLIGLNDTIIEDAGTAGGIDTVEAVNRGIDLLNFANVENLTLFGNLGYGGSGTNEANVLRADGNTAANLLAGRGGNDLYYVGAGDTIFELAGAIGGTDTVCGVNRGINLAHFANVENIVLFGSLGYGASGNAGVNIIRGDTNSGANKLVGAGGNDLFYVGAGDTIFEVAGAAGGNDTVAATNRGINLVSYANVENLTLYGTLGYGGAGTTGANVINGETNTGANLLVGLAGNDTYIVGTGDRVTEKLNAGPPTCLASAVRAPIRSWATTA